MPTDKTDSGKTSSVTPLTTVQAARTLQADDLYVNARVMPESAEHQLRKYMQERSGTHYGHAGLILNQRYSKPG